MALKDVPQPCLLRQRGRLRLNTQLELETKTGRPVDCYFPCALVGEPAREGEELVPNRFSQRLFTFQTFCPGIL